MSQLTVLSTLILVANVWTSVHGHARFVEPPSRASMWRFGFANPPNYNDNELFCGGFSNQQANGGKCGVCGDPWNGERKHEAGGKYAKGIIVRNYEQGDVIEAKIDVTANHLGWFEFKICANNDVDTAVSQSCLDQHPMIVRSFDGVEVNPKTSRVDIGTVLGVRTFTLELPKDLTCEQCVIQWRYHTGNNWGTDAGASSGCKGCGPQEEFYGCSDVSISSGSSDNETDTSSSSTSTVTTTTAAETTTTTNSDTSSSTTTTTATATNSDTTSSTQTTTDKPTTTTTSANVGAHCCAAGPWTGQAATNKWCKDNCAMGNCPSSHCLCGSDPCTETKSFTCKPAGPWVLVSGIQSWCDTNCKNGNDAVCKATYCSCS